MNVPFAPGSVSLRLYPHNDLPAPAIVDELRAQAALAAEHGFDGVMTSEHHGGFHGYLPNPLQAAGWCLEAMDHGWAAPCPLLLPLRPPALVAEEIAWLAARFPGRVGLGVASGALLQRKYERREAGSTSETRKLVPGATLAGVRSNRNTNCGSATIACTATRMPDSKSPFIRPERYSLIKPSTSPALTGRR